MIAAKGDGRRIILWRRDRNRFASFYRNNQNPAVLSLSPLIPVTVKQAVNNPGVCRIFLFFLIHFFGFRRGGCIRVHVSGNHKIVPVW